VRHWERSGDIGGANAPGLITGSLVDGVRGPLAWSYGDYLVITQAGAPWRVVASQPLPGSLPAWPAPGPDQFSAATFNTQNLEGWGLQFTKVISTLLQMNGPTFLALQEVNPYSVFPDLVERLEAAGYSYEYAYSHADAGGHGVALLWRSEAVQEVHWSTGYQACSPVGSPSSTYDPLWDTCRSRGEYPLFARRPVVITGTLSIAGSRYPVIVIANHFKSRMEGESVEQRRLEEARFVSGLAGDLAGSGSPILIVMGDLNDFEDSPPLQALYAGGTLTTTWTTIPGENRFSYNYLGVSQVLDHILVSPDLLAWLEAAAPLHLNADFPYSPYARDGHLLWRSSDHDPVAALFTVHFVNRIYLPYLSFSR
jgi:exonuclease III